MQTKTLNPYIFKAFYMLLALGLAGRCIEKGVEAAFIGLAVLLSLYIGFKEFSGERQQQFSDKIKTSTHNPLLFVLGAMLISWGVSSYFGIKADYNLKKWGEVLAIVLAGAILYIGVRRTPLEILEKFPRYVMWAGTAFSLLLIIESLNIVPWLTEQIRNTSKGPLHTQIRSFSSVVAILIPFAWVEALKKDRIKYWIFPTVMLTAAMVSGGRSGWLAIAMCALCFAFIYPWKAIPRPNLHKTLFAIQLLTGAAIGSWLYKNMVGNAFFEARVGLAKEAGFSGGSGRLDIWQFAFDKFTETPWLGVGVKGFRHLDFSGVELASSMHPHNAVLELLVETGIVGTLLALTFAGLLFYRLGYAIYQNKSYKNKRIHNLAVACSCALIAFFTSSLTLTSIFHAWWLTYFVVLYIIIDGAHIAISRTSK